MTEIFNSPKKSTNIRFVQKQSDGTSCLYEVYNRNENKIYKQDGKLWIDGFNSRYEILFDDWEKYGVKFAKIPLNKIGGNKGYSYIVKLETLYIMDKITE